jgi:myo-inositol-1(or 4)-monophosphatase
MDNMDKFIKDIAVKAGKITLKYFGEVHTDYMTKANKLDVVTKADLASNKFLIDAIKKKYPDHGILSEETGEENINAKYVWIIDPIDGTLNFSRGIPLYMVMIALMVDNVVTMSVLYDPVHKELYFARKNKGAFLNGKRIHCSSEKTLKDTVGSMNSRLDEVLVKRVTKFINKLPDRKLRARGLFSMGIIAAYQSTGRQDWIVTQGGKFWDYAPTVLILQESGCKVTDLMGQPWQRASDSLVVANPILHKQLIKALN